MRDLSQIIDLIKRHSGVKKDKEVAKMLGISGPALSNHKNRGSIPYDDLATFCRQERLPLDWLLSGSTDDSPTNTASPKPSHTENKVPTDELSERYVLVPLYDVEASCGGGAIVHSEQIIDHLAFLRDWIVGELGLKADKVMLIKAMGDSMEPTIKDGALLLVDRNLDRPTGDAVYVIRQDGDLLVKRIQNLMDGTVKIISSNPDYETLTVQASSLEVLGKVVWGGQKI